MVFVETPTNPVMTVTDLRAVSELAHTRGAKVVCDNTFLSPYFQRPIDLGCDIVVHSTTKYLNGHSDSVGGFVALNDETDAEWLRALDAAVLQKVLPRLSGNRAKLEIPLSTVCTYLRDLTLPTIDVANAEFDRNAPAKLPSSYRRAVEMLESLRSFGFVSFFK